MWRSRTSRLLPATTDILQGFSHPAPLPEQQQLEIVEESFPKLILLLKLQRGTQMGLEASGRGEEGQQREKRAPGKTDNREIPGPGHRVLTMAQTLSKLSQRAEL